MLTRKQKELLTLIRERVEIDGVPPSFDEMKTALGLRSKSGIHRLITGLEERGFIKRLPHRARALEITRLPDDLEKTVAARAATHHRPSFEAPIVPDVPAVLMPTISLPLYGRIAAGTPIEALQDPTSNFEVPAGLLSDRKGHFERDEHYALEVAGDSMMEAGIMDGDRIVIRKCDTAENGAIVVALIEDTEATLKYLEKRGGTVALIPANKNYETRVLPASHVKVQGKLVGLVRKY